MNFKEPIVSKKKANRCGVATMVVKGKKFKDHAGTLRRQAYSTLREVVLVQDELEYCNQLGLKYIRDIANGDYKYKYPLTSYFIRDWLRTYAGQKAKIDYIYHVYVAYRYTLQKVMGRKHVGSYGNFRNYFYVLEKLDLIKKVRSSRSSYRVGLHDRIYYQIVISNQNSSSWGAPFRYLYPKRK